MNKEVMRYENIVKFLGNTMAESFEIILIDLTGKEYQIVSHLHHSGSNINVTMNQVKKAISNNTIIEKGMMMNSLSMNEDGKLLKTSIYLIKDDEVVVGALCINLQCDTYMKVQKLLSGLLNFELDGTNNNDGFNENDKPHYEEVTLDTIAKVIAQEIENPNKSKPSERVDAIVELYNMGIFEIKGSVARAAKELKVSEQSVYRYVSKIRKARSY